MTAVFCSEVAFSRRFPINCGMMETMKTYELR